MHVQVALISALAVAVSGCASVQLGRKADEVESAMAAEEREAMAVALEQLESTPWEEAEQDDGSAAFMTVLFGGSGPSPKDEAKAYLKTLNVSQDDVPSAVRSDVDKTLAAAWHMVDAGRAASKSMQPQSSDVRMVEEAITEARHCRLVYAQAMTLLAKDGHDVAREDVLYVKDEFTRAILELGRTADALSRLVEGPRPGALASEPALALTSSF